MRKVLTDVAESIRGTTNFGLLPDASSTGAYPIDLDFTLVREALYYEPKDVNGIPLRSYSSVGRQYSPTRVAAFGLANFNRFRLTGCHACKQRFLRAADWFMQSPDGRWRYDFDWGELKAPWISCMAQGEAMSVLTRAYKITGNKEYFDTAVLAIEPLSLGIADGGLRSEINGGLPFLEEYPTRQPSHTLNGFLYAMIGIHDLGTIEPEALRKVQFSDLLRTLVENWRLWDLGYWSAYDLKFSNRGRRNPATVSYHRLHISQLRYIALCTGAQSLLDVAVRWEAQQHRVANRLRALAAKIKYRRENPPQR